MNGTASSFSCWEIYIEARRPRTLQHELMVDITGKNTVVMNCGIRYYKCLFVSIIWKIHVSVYQMYHGSILNIQAL